MFEQIPTNLSVCRSFSSVEEVLHWCFLKPEARTIVNIFYQDECNADIAVSCEEGFLVFESSCLGAIFQVFWWSFLPQVDALLQKRLERGWRPVPTPMQDGEKILGYAACLFK